MSKYCKEMTKKIADKLRKGMPRGRTCDGVGINYDTFCEWMKRPEFSETIKKAESDFIETQVENIQEHANKKKNFYASAWLLERRCFEDFGNKQKLEHTQPKPFVFQIQKTYVDNQEQLSTIQNIIDVEKDDEEVAE